MTLDEKCAVVAEMQAEMLEYRRTKNVRHCHVINAMSALLTWECMTGMTPVMAPDKEAAPIKEAAE